MRLLTIAVSLWLTAVGSAVAEDYVIIESKSFPQGQRGCEVRIYLSNDHRALGLVIVLELRELTVGTFPGANLDFLENPMGRTYHSGLGGGWNPPGSRSRRFYDDPSSQTCSGPESRTYQSPLQQFGYPNPDNPDAILYAAIDQNQFPEWDGSWLMPGADTPGVTPPSYILRFDAGMTTGQFEIDTCCVWPENRLSYVDDRSVFYFPSFTKSIVTIVPCTCLCASDPNCDGVTNIVDVASAIGVAFRGVADITDSTCSISRTDTNADYQTDIVDVVRLILVGFRDGDAATYLINPCAEE